jgi:dTDP-4-amino-4,6-dideoxygalactose transaminase
MQTTELTKIPCLDLKRQYQQIKPEILSAIEQVLDDTAFSGGKYVEIFEKEFAAYCQTGFSVAVNNGTSALHLAMLALGIGEDDEVIVPGNTFISTAWGASYAGATPVFVDCTADTWEIDASKIEEKITVRTKAIAGVHLYGQPFDVDAVKAIAKKHNLFLIEDAAQAHGAYYKGQRVGGFGEMACFSFYPGKNLGTYGEGGGITTHYENYVKHLHSLRQHGSVQRYYHDEIGFNMRMGGLEAGVLSVKLKYLDEWNQRRKDMAKVYQQNIRNEKITMQRQPDFADSVYHLFVITSPDREDLAKYLNKNEIFPGMHYPVPCHLQKAYAYLNYKTGDLPNAEYLASHCLSLPMFAEMTDEEVEQVVEVMNAY